MHMGIIVLHFRFLIALNALFGLLAPVWTVFARDTPHVAVLYCMGKNAGLHLPYFSFLCKRKMISRGWLRDHHGGGGLDGGVADPGQPRCAQVQDIPKVEEEEEEIQASTPGGGDEVEQGKQQQRRQQGVLRLRLCLWKQRPPSRPSSSLLAARRRPGDGDPLRARPLPRPPGRRRRPTILSARPGRQNVPEGRRHDRDRPGDASHRLHQVGS